VIKQYGVSMEANSKKEKEVYDSCTWLTNRIWICVGDVVRVSIGRSIVEGVVTDVLTHGSRIAVDAGDKTVIINISRVTWFSIISRGEISSKLFKREQRDRG